MWIDYRDKTGERRSGRVTGIAGLHVTVTAQVTDGDGLASSQSILIGSHDCDDPSRFWDIWRSFGGAALVDRDGNPLEF